MQNKNVSETLATELLVPRSRISMRNEAHQHRANYDDNSSTSDLGKESLHAPKNENKFVIHFSCKI